MSKYELTWITEHLAAGHAPFSHEDLAEMRRQGIDAIVNLCGEYCDLHEIQQDSGFEVYYLPIADECAPDMAELKKPLSGSMKSSARAKKCWSTAASGLVEPERSRRPICSSTG